MIFEKTSDSENYSTSSSSRSDWKDIEEVFDEIGEAGWLMEPYAGEPLKRNRVQENNDDEDEDGLTPAELEARFEQEVAVDRW